MVARTMISLSLIVAWFRLFADATVLVITVNYLYYQGFNEALIKVDE